MGLLYDITKDYLYQEGLEKGLTKGREESKREFIARLLARQKLTVEEIADAAGTTVEHVEAVAEELKK